MIVVVFITCVNNSSATSPTAFTVPVIPSTPRLLPLPLQVLPLLLILGTLNSYALGNGCKTAGISPMEVDRTAVTTLFETSGAFETFG